MVHPGRDWAFVLAAGSDVPLDARKSHCRRRRTGLQVKYPDVTGDCARRCHGAAIAARRGARSPWLSGRAKVHVLLRTVGRRLDAVPCLCGRNGAAPPASSQATRRRIL